MGSTSEYNRKRIDLIGRDKFNKLANAKMATYRLLNPVKYLFMAAKERAKKYGYSFKIKESDIVIPSHCPILGIKLRRSIGRMKDCSPSIDRINNKRGYVPDNIIVISFRANRIKSDSSLDELEKILKFYKQGKWRA